MKRGDTNVTWDDIEKDAGACLRLEIHTSANVSTALAYLTMIPISQPDLLKLAERWEVDPSGSRIPVIAVGMGDPKKNKRSLETKLMIQEGRQAGYGLGVLPLIQQVFRIC